jgi:hypothetical protein
MIQNYARPRALVLGISVAIIFLFVCGGGIFILSQAVENTLPGDVWFGVRQFGEAFRMWLAHDPGSRAEWRRTIITWRLHDLAARAGTRHELVAFSSVDEAINTALITITDLPADERAGAIQQVATLMRDERELLVKTGLAHDPTFLARFDAKAAAIQAAHEYAAVAPERLYQIAVPLPAPSTPATTDSSTMVVVAPRTVPASGGFKHSFPLDGAHTKIACEQCHIAGKYAGTARECMACHRDAHNPTLGRQCAACHTTKAWKPAKKK